MIGDWKYTVYIDDIVFHVDGYSKGNARYKAWKLFTEYSSMSFGDFIKRCKCYKRVVKAKEDLYY